MKTILLVAFLVISASALPKPFRNRMLPDGRIIGGSAVDISEVPWQVSLQYYGSHICGGSVISAEWVVTAAHCTDGSSASQLSIRAGTSQLGAGGQVSSIQAIHQNPLYDDWDIDYDISLLRLSTPLTLGSNIAAVQLPTVGQSWSAGTSTLVTGWGTTSEGSSSLPNNLLGVTVQIVSNQDCQSAYSSYPITDRMLCAGVSGGGKDACQGDSGGPLVVDNILIGIVSWGLGCARPQYPGVYANVGNLREYITEVAGL